MEASKILTADVLDIIFNNRNKDYGAYELRRHYQRRLILSLMFMGAICLLLIGGYVLAGKSNHQFTSHFVDIPPTKLIAVVPDKRDPVQPPPPPKPPAQQIAQRIVTTPAIVTDNVPEEDKPPINEDLENVKIGTMNIDGPAIDVITPPIEAVTRGIIEQPVKENPGDKVFEIVEIESSYPGGIEAWRRFLIKTFRYPQAAIDNGIEGTVVVQFIVDREGVVSHVEAISGPEDLRAEAIRVINKSGKWTPAIQNGRSVRSYKKQPFVFKLASE